MQVFVYGTLMRGGRYWPKFCEGKVTAVDPAQMPGFCYDFPQLGYPGVCETPVFPGDADRASGHVAGEILSFPDAIADAALARLDWLEDFAEGRPAHLNEYQRVVREAHLLSDGAPRRVWAYVMLPDVVKRLGGKLHDTQQRSSW